MSPSVTNQRVGCMALIEIYDDSYVLTPINVNIEQHQSWVVDTVLFVRDDNLSVTHNLMGS